MLPADSIPLVSALLLTGKSAWHPDYQRVVDYAQRCRQFATGDVESLLRVYWPEETEADFQKLLRLYVATCSSTWKEITNPFYQVGRLRDGQVEVKFSYAESISEPQRARYAASLSQAVDHYYNDRPLQDYLAERIVPTVAMTDPNAWLLTEFTAFDYRSTQARPAPVLLPCSAVVHFTRVAGTVTSMTARYLVDADSDTTIALLSTNELNLALHRYTHYLPDHAVDFWPVTPGGVATLPGGGDTADGEVLDQQGRVVYHYRVYEHGAGKVPACPIGYVPDQGAVGLVFLSPLDPALSWLELELKTGHELQIVMRNMAMPRQLQYVTACTGYKEDGGCVAGMCTTPRDKNYEDLRCRRCGGTGTPRISASSRQVIEVPLSAEPTENKLKLTDMLAFVGPDPAIPDFQLKFQDWISEKLLRKLFNSNTLIKDTTVNTATQKRQEQQQKAIALSPFAGHFSYLYIYHGGICAMFVDAGQPEIIYDFPPDLELTSIEDLYAQLAAARTAGARPDEVARIQLAIMRKSLASDREGLRKYQVRSRFIPLLGFDNLTIVQWAALGRITERDQLMYVNQDRIFADAETVNPRFYELPYAEQLKLVEEQIQLIKDESATTAAPSAFAQRLNLNPTNQAVGATV
ncbi:MAG: hypothetical protein ACRYFZ_09590 [Janthinobacterium lividum]